MKIKKIAQIAVCSLLLLTLTGCQNTKDKESANIFNSSESTATKVENTVSDIQKLEGGLSYVEFEGDDCFETFIRQKGVSSDSEVIKFLAANLFAEADRLHFSDVMFGCSTVSVSNENGDRLFGRNFDWQTCNAMIVKSVPNVGYASISTVNTDYIRQGAGSASALLSTDKQALVALYAPIDGMNEAGVCISVNMLDDTTSIKQNTEKPDLTTTTAVRYILNHAGSVDEAIKILESNDLHSSLGIVIHFAISDKSGKSVVVEYVNNKMVVIDTPVVTNFYFDKINKAGISGDKVCERYATLMSAIDGKKLSEDDVRDALDSVSMHNYEFTNGSTTEWSIVFNQSTLEAHYYHREDYTKQYDFKLK